MSFTTKEATQHAGVLLRAAATDLICSLAYSPGHEVWEGYQSQAQAKLLEVAAALDVGYFGMPHPWDLRASDAWQRATAAMEAAMETLGGKFQGTPLSPALMERLGRPKDLHETYLALVRVGGWTELPCGCQEIGTGERYSCAEHSEETSPVEIRVTSTVGGGETLPCPFCERTIECWVEGSHTSRILHAMPGICEGWHERFPSLTLNTVRAMALEKKREEDSVEWIAEGIFDPKRQERLAEQVKAAGFYRPEFAMPDPRLAFRPDRVLVPPELMTEKMAEAESMEAMADALVDFAQNPEHAERREAWESGAERARRDVERLAGKEAIEALGGVVIGPSPDQLDWQLARYVRAQPFTGRALPSKVTVLELISWLRKYESGRSYG